MSTIILAISTEVFYTRIAISKDENIIYHKYIDHSKQDFILMDNVVDQLPFRRDVIMKQLRDDAVDVKSIQYVVAEGGLLKPCESGVYEKMMKITPYTRLKYFTNKKIKGKI